MKHRHKRVVKRLILQAGLCLGLSWFLHALIVPETSNTSASFDLDGALQALPEDQRDAARSKWNALTEFEQQQAQRVIQNLSDAQKQEALNRLKTGSK